MDPKAWRQQREQKAPEGALFHEREALTAIGRELASARQIMALSDLGWGARQDLALSPSRVSRIDAALVELGVPPLDLSNLPPKLDRPESFVDMLLRAGADVSAIPTLGNARSLSRLAADDLLRAGADVSAVPTPGNARSQSPLAIDALLRAGADVSAVPTPGNARSLGRFAADDVKDVPAPARELGTAKSQQAALDLARLEKADDIKIHIRFGPDASAEPATRMEVIRGGSDQAIASLSSMGKSAIDPSSSRTADPMARVVGDDNDSWWTQEKSDLRAQARCEAFASSIQARLDGLAPLLAATGLGPDGSPAPQPTTARPRG